LASPSVIWALQTRKGRYPDHRLCSIPPQLPAEAISSQVGVVQLALDGLWRALSLFLAHQRQLRAAAIILWQKHLAVWGSAHFCCMSGSGSGIVCIIDAHRNKPAIKTPLSPPKLPDDFPISVSSIQHHLVVKTEKFVWRYIIYLFIYSGCGCVVLRLGSQSSCPEPQLLDSIRFILFTWGEDSNSPWTRTLTRRFRLPLNIHPSFNISSCQKYSSWASTP